MRNQYRVTTTFKNGHTLISPACDVNFDTHYGVLDIWWQGLTGDPTAQTTEFDEIQSITVERVPETVLD